MKTKIKLSITFLLLLFSFCYVLSQNSLFNEYEKGQLILKVKTNIFKFPLEVYGAYISIKDHSVQIDSVVCQEFQPGTRHRVKEHIINYNQFKTSHPEIFKKIYLKLPPELVTLFKKYGVYYIARVSRTFAPEDTIPHQVRTRLGWKTLKSEDYNKILLIKFNKCVNVVEFCNLLKKIKFIIFADPDYKIVPFSVPNDPWWINLSGGIDQEDYLGSNIMDFEGAWSFVTGDNPDVTSIRIAFIDVDFTNADFLNDLWQNAYWGAYSGNGSGHGTWVASIASASTNNGYLIAGATWNCEFVPYVAQTVSEVISKLEEIRLDLTYTHTWVVNMSFGTSNYSPSVQQMENVCDDLKNNYEVILVAAVCDVCGGSNNIVYPAGFNSVIGVGASNRADSGLINTSNWGDDVEFVATGESVFSLRHDTEDWDTRTGTSFAAPFVSSLCALIYSTENGYFMTPDEVRSKIQLTANYIYDNNHNKGFWRINAGDAVSIITGIWDAISVNGPTLLYPNQNYEFTGEFIDNPPYGKLYCWSLALDFEC